MLLHGRRVSGYRELSPSRLSAYLAAMPELAARLGGAPVRWRVEQVPDSEMNLVFLVDGPDGRLCVKQAVPSVMIGGETVTVPLERSVYEEAALTLTGRLAPGDVAPILHFDSEQFLMVTEHLGGHLNLREALVAGRRVEGLADRLGGFLARTLFATSAFGMGPAERRERLVFFAGNGEMREITDELVFARPFDWSGDPTWISPELDGHIRAVRADAELKRRVAELKLKFLTVHEALLHGDFHTGSLMVRDDDLKVIDFEFAQFGPIGFDLGLLMGNLLIACFSQPGHATPAAPRHDVGGWLLETVERTWSVFHDGFVRLWEEGEEHRALPPALFEGPGGSEQRRTLRESVMRGIFEDMLRYAGLAVIRRIMGPRPVIDFTRIADRQRRAEAEGRALLVAVELVKDAHHVDHLGEVTAAVRQLMEEPAGRG